MPVRLATVAVAAAAFAALVQTAGPRQPETEEGPRVAVAHSLEKIRPDRELPGSVRAGASIELLAARGECEAAQVVVTAGEKPLQALAAEPTPLKGPSKATLGVAVYRIAYVPVDTPSNTEGAPGLWPDPLIPAVDAWGEKRGAFPVEVAAGRHQPVLIEVCVPGEAVAGEYRGTLVLREQQGLLAEVGLTVKVHRARIPATSSLPVTFGLSAKSVIAGHDGDPADPKQRLELGGRYAREALAHRISVHAMSLLPPEVKTGTEGLEVDFTRWDAEIAPFLDGEALSGGARFTAIDLRTPEGLSSGQLQDYYRQVERHFRERGWLDRLFAYAMDEPKPEQREELIQRLEALASAPGIRRLVTTSLDPALVGRVDIWVANLNCLEFKRSPDEFCPLFVDRAAYRIREKRGERLWWYQSCSSHGCGNGPFGKRELDSYFSGWPSYMVDIDGAAARVMGWLAFARDIGGELYFDMVYAYNERARSGSDPWDGVRHFGGNGDGTLFYPGRPDRIGGKTHVPVASLRLKHIRDGLEDYELLRLLEKSGPRGARQARRLAGKMARRLYDFERDPARYEQAREEIFRLLDGARGR